MPADSQQLKHSKAMTTMKRRTGLSSLPCFIIWIVFTGSQLGIPTEACNMLTEGWRPKSLENRTVMAQVVIAGTVVRLRDQALTPPGGSGVYSAEVRVDEVYKGYPFFNKANALSNSHPGGNVYVIWGFGSRERCLAEVRQGKRYIMFLTAVPVTGGREDDGVRLLARYDDIFGAAVEFDAEQERKIHNVVGWRAWAPWSPCPVSCGDGIQTRRRMCVQDVPDACEGAAEQNRHCNLFECQDTKDLLQYMSLSSFPAGVRRSPRRWRAYHISQDAVLKVPISTVYPSGFPEEFSILLVVKPPRYFASNLNGYLYAMLITGPDGGVQLGVQLSSSPALVFSKRDEVTGRMRPDAVSFSGYSVLERKWHMLAFSVRRDSVTMYADCTKEFKMDLKEGENIRVSDRLGDISIGNSKPNMIDMYFEGDIEQLSLINDPDAAALQCSAPMGTFDAESALTALNITKDLQRDMDSSLTFPVIQIPTSVNPKPKGPDEEAHAPITKENPPTAPSYQPEESGSTNDNRPYIGDVPENDFPFLAEPTDGQTTTAAPFYNENFFDIDIDVIDWVPEYDRVPSSPLPDKQDINFKEGNEIFYVQRPGSPNTANPNNPSNIVNNDRTKGIPQEDTTLTPTTDYLTEYIELTTQTSTVAPTVPPTEPTILPTTEPTTLPTSIPTTTVKEAPTTVPNKVTVVSRHRQESAYRPDGWDTGRQVPVDEVGNAEEDGSEDANWSTWSTCSRTCGTGTRYRFARCHPGSRLRDCKTGRGIAAQTRTCHLNNCHVPTLKWSAWSMCSRTCGDGVQMRMAYCYDNQVPECQNGRKIAVERKLCRNRHCFDVCKPSCQNGGFCRPEGRCSCPTGFIGASCETELCTHPCQNGGQCVAKDYCRCPAGFAPPRCSPVCHIGCRNGGTCVAPNQCECPAAFTGSVCERAACIRPCQNGGTCIGPNKCSCIAGYQGQYCENPICFRACENGGTCVRPDFCRCPTAYRGPTCEIAYCRVTCRNGGRCTGPDTCTCAPHFTGSFCQKRIHNSYQVSRARPAVAPFPSNFARTKSAQSQRRHCKLRSTLISFQRSYVKPVAKTVQVQCGYWTQQLCTQTRMGYETRYRTYYRMSYRRECVSIVR